MSAKTPRGWVLARHAASDARLDALRRAALPEPSLTVDEFLHELFHPHRTFWRSLAAVWVGLVLFYFATHQGIHSPDPSAPPPAIIAAWLSPLSPPHEDIVQIRSQP